MKLKITTASLLLARISVITIASVIAAASVAMGVTNAFALSPYQSGYNHGVSDARKAAQGLGGLIEGINFPKGRSTPLIDLAECNDIILVDRNYFLQNKRLIEAWASQEF